ncbi:MAG: hypothetical protein QMD94_03090 [Candidatus Omnitrophota bacterium]|nr:hypothetical protein [Candidatus Omnitrophota bacterium]
MKRVLGVLAVLVLALPFCVKAQEVIEIEETEEVIETIEVPKEFLVYADRNSRQNHYVPSGWMGDYGDVKMNDQFADSPYSGSTCIEFIYSAKRSQDKGWAGVYWQNPANNWGGKKGGYDLTGMTKLTFWAKGGRGGEIIQKFKVGGIGIEPKNTYPDSVDVQTEPIELTDTWKQYTVNLAGKDLSYISGGFAWVTNANLNPQGAQFYIDDIKFEVDPSIKPESKKQRSMPFYVYADRSSVNHFIASGWMGDYSDLKFDGASKDDPYLGDTCIKIIYNNNSSQGSRWAGMYWQEPANNWGNIDAGYDLSKAAKLTFFARGEKGGERIEEFKVGGIMGEYCDSDSSNIGPVILNKEWTQYSIDLKGKDMSYIIGGFCWAANLDNNPQGVVFYLDEIRYE